MDFHEGITTLVAESRELLEDMERTLLTLDGSSPDGETVNSLFRAAHTIKGAAGLFGLRDIVHFTHVLESVLDAVRVGDVLLEKPFVQLLLNCRDHIGLLVAELEVTETEPSDLLKEAGRGLLEQLRRYLNNSAGSARPVALTSAAGALQLNLPRWHVSLRFAASAFMGGVDPLSVLRRLGSLGRLHTVVTLAEELPAPEVMDPEVCYLGFEVVLESSATRRDIERVFDSILDHCTPRLLAPHSALEDFACLIRTLPESESQLVSALARCGWASAPALCEALNASAASTPSLRSVGRADVQLNQSVSQKRPETRARGKDENTVRVDARKLDHLINLVGELIIASASARMLARSTPNAELQELTATLGNLVEEVRDGALQLRMVKIGSTFSRFSRVVHDVSRELGKSIELQVSGEDTELDKTVVEKIADPLLHLVRNAMDHGIELPEVRRAVGKPEVGQLRLNAFHDSGSVVIEVSDDGAGLRQEAILAKALSKGLIEPGHAPTASEIFDLVFEPGFSTAEKVTDLSGRGVGMDVVKRNITALRGTVALRSEPGQGTVVSIRLPLTLAIIDGFLVGLGDSVYVLPLDNIEECIQLEEDEEAHYTNLRGRMLPFIRLRDLFGIQAPRSARQSVVVVHHGPTRVGLVVDSLLGELQTVIKPLNKVFERAKCISGSSILGTGQVALILDVPNLIHSAQKAEVREAERCLAM